MGRSSRARFRLKTSSGKKKEKKSHFKQVKNKSGQSGCMLDRVDPFIKYIYIYIYTYICICNLVSHAANYLV